MVIVVIFTTFLDGKSLIWNTFSRLRNTRGLHKIFLQHNCQINKCTYVILRKTTTLNFYDMVRRRRTIGNYEWSRNINSLVVNILILYVSLCRFPCLPVSSPILFAPTQSETYFSFVLDVCQHLQTCRF